MACHLFFLSFDRGQVHAHIDVTGPTGTEEVLWRSLCPARFRRVVGRSRSSRQLHRRHPSPRKHGNLLTRPPTLCPPVPLPTTLRMPRLSLETPRMYSLEKTPSVLA